MYRVIIRNLCALSLLIFAGSVLATPVTYNFTASNFVPVVSGTFSPPSDTVNGSVTLDGSNVVDMNLTLGSRTYAASDAGLMFFGVFDLIGGTGFENEANAISPGNDDFWFTFNVNTLQFDSFAYSINSVNEMWFTNTGSVTTGASVPEPSAILLLVLGLAGLAFQRISRKA